MRPIVAQPTGLEKFLTGQYHSLPLFLEDPTMRMVFILALVLSAAIGLVSSDGAEPGQPPALPHSVPPLAVQPSYGPPGVSAVQPGPPVVPSVPSQPPAYTVWQAEGPQFSHDEITRLRQEFVAIAKKRAERMDGPELQKGIAEMRRQWLIAELTALGSESDDVRAGVAVMVLKTQDQKELKKLFRSIVEEMDPEKPKAK